MTVFPGPNSAKNQPTQQTQTLPSQQSPSQRPSGFERPPAPSSPVAPRPEAVNYLLVVWLVTGVGEVIHQLAQVVMSLSNKSVIIAQLKTTLQERGDLVHYPQSVLNLAAYLYIFGTALVMLLVVGALFYLLGKLAEPSKSAGTARRLWFAFSLYYGLRVLFVFMTSPAGTEVPAWLFFLDSALQILIGCAAVMGIVFALKEETVDYTGELAQIRKLEKEMREKEQEKRDKREAKKKKDGKK